MSTVQRRTSRPILFLVAVWALTTALWLTPGITRPDGVGYYVYLPSTWISGDLLFFDEWRAAGLVENGRIAYKEVTPTDHLGNHWTVGSALYWFPSFVAGDAIRSLVPPLSSFRRDGYSLPYNVAVVFASAFAGLLTMLLCFFAARRIADQVVSAAVACGVWLGSPVIWYALKNSLMAHVTSALASSVVVILAMRARERQTDARVFAIALATGVAFAVRPQNAPIVLVPLILLDAPRIWRSWQTVASFVLGGILGMLPQLVVNGFLYGAPVPTGGASGGMWPWASFERVWFVESLFSWFHGVVPWTPFLAIGIVGFAFLWRDDRRLAVAAIAVFGIEWLANATLDRYFWSGYSFGQRRFDNCTILFALGAAALLRRVPKWLAVALVAITSAWTLSLLIASSLLLDLNRYYALPEILSAQLAALARVDRYAVPLSFVPPPARGAVAFVLLVMAILTAGAAWAAWKSRRRENLLIATAAAYLIGASLFLAWCGARDASRIASYAELIAYNRQLGTLSGWTETKIELLKEEERYLLECGRDGDAAETRAEIEGLVAAQGAAIRRQLESQRVGTSAAPPGAGAVPRSR